MRPVPLEAHIQGYPGRFYCPRMATMNKPAYAAIQLHSPIKPVLVFVSSRRQTRLTALDLIAFAAAADKPRQFLHMAEHELGQTLARVRVRARTLPCSVSPASCARLICCPEFLSWGFGWLVGALDTKLSLDVGCA